MFVLAQVRVPPVLTLERYIPDIQEGFRRAGFPRFAQVQGQEITLAGAPQTLLRVETPSRWLFLDRPSTTGITLASDFIVVSTTSYGTFESFLERIDFVVSLVQRLVHFDFFERVGLRYVDLVRPENGDALEDYFAPGLTGLNSSSLAVKGTESRFEQTAATDIGRLVFRLTKSDGNTFFPPDLLPLELTPSFSFEEQGPHAVLDFDHFSVGTRDFDVDEIVDMMWRLHDLVGRAFQAAVTEHALEQWGRESNAETGAGA